MLPKQHRLTHADEFRTAMRTGQRRGGAIVTTHLAPSSPSAPARFGFIVSKAVGNAVVRNRVKRRLRAVAAEIVSAGLVGTEVVVRALPAATGATFAGLRTELLDQLDRLGQDAVIARVSA